VYFIPSMHVTPVRQHRKGKRAPHHQRLSGLRYLLRVASGEPKLISAAGNVNGGGPVLKTLQIWLMGNIYICRGIHRRREHENQIAILAIAALFVVAAAMPKVGAVRR